MGEFRIYYDDNGSVICYTSEPVELEAKYIVIDADIYSEHRMDIKIIDQKIVKNNDGALLIKYKLSDNGIRCAKEDISIIVNDEYNGSTNNWEIETHEYRYS